MQKKEMSCLMLPDGRVTTDPAEMRRHAVHFYTGLFGAEDCSGQCAAELLEGLPQLSPSAQLTTVVEQLASGRAPGIDGLPIEFYKRFWDCLREDFHMLMLECFNTGRLPSSCRGAVFSLLPKKKREIGSS